MKDHKNRLQLAKISSAIQLHAILPHRPDVIDQNVAEFFNEKHPDAISRVITCQHVRSKTENSFDLYLERSDLEVPQDLYSDIATDACDKISALCAVNCCKIILFKTCAF